MKQATKLVSVLLLFGLTITGCAKEEAGSYIDYSRPLNLEKQAVRNAYITSETNVVLTTVLGKKVTAHANKVFIVLDQNLDGTYVDASKLWYGNYIEGYEFLGVDRMVLYVRTPELRAAWNKELKMVIAAEYNSLYKPRDIEPNVVPLF